MSQPSEVVAEIVTSLTALLGSTVSEVKSVDGDFGKDGTQFTTTKPTAVLVTCLGFRDVEFKWDPPTASCHFAAFCVAKFKDDDLSPGDVAANLAALVAAHVSRNQWSTTQKRAEKIRAVNLRKVGERSSANVWAVEWLQDVPLTPELDPLTLNRLAKITMTYEMGDAATPDIQSEVEFPE